MESKKRIVFIDRIKVFACFLVVIQHSISAEWVKMSGRGGLPYGTWCVINLIYLFSRTGVPLFLMCSGALMLDKNRDIKGILRKNILFILKIYVWWMLIYGIVDVVLSYETMTLRTGINIILKDILFGQYHTWFIATLIGLYAVTPLLKAITDQRQLEQYFLLLSFIFTILVPYVGKIESLGRAYSVLEDVNMNFVVGYPLYYVLGHFFIHMNGRKNEKPMVVGIFAISVLSAFTLSNRAAIHLAGGDAQLPYTEFSIAGFLICTSIFRLFQICGRNPHGRYDALIRGLCSFGFATYLMHPLFLFIPKSLTGVAVIPAGIIVWVLSLGVSAFVSRTPLNKLLIGGRN